MLSTVRLLAVLGGASLLVTTFVSEYNLESIKQGLVRKASSSGRLVLVELDSGSMSTTGNVEAANATKTTTINAAGTTAMELTNNVIKSKPITPKSRHEGIFEYTIKSRNSQQNISTDTNSTSSWPRVAWLMSFPNSGTSYTGQFVKQASNTRTATNYGEENLLNGKSVPIFPDHPEGPFYVDPSSSRVRNQLSNPPHYVLTKTHCAGYRTNSPPELYVERITSFARKCASTKYIADSKSGVVLTGRYQARDMVDKAIHLYRNPFDNIVSRFHLELKRQSTHDPLTAGLTKSRKGFRKFCKRMDERWIEHERTSIVYTDELLSVMQNIPCHSDFVRYVEWHNQAHVTTSDLQLETLLLHYETYAAPTYEATTQTLLDFLELTRKSNNVHVFVEGKEYSREYFTKDERAAVKNVLQELALQVTWDNLKHYFAA